MLDKGHIDDAIMALEAFILENKDSAQAYYMLGNAYCRRNDWKHAIENYCSAIELNPDSPAVEAYNKVQEILSFYCHDLYNP